MTVAQLTVTLRYQSGEDIKKGDCVLFHLRPAEIELVACAPDDPATTWYVEEFGGGVIREPNDPNLRLFPLTNFLNTKTWSLFHELNRISHSSFP